VTPPSASRGFRLGFLADLWPYVRPYRRGFAGCLLLLALSFGVELLGPWIIRRALDGPLTEAGDGAAGELALLATAFAATLLAGAALGWCYALRTSWNGQRVVRDVRLGLFAHMLRLPQGFFDRNPPGRLTTRVTTDVENLNELISTGVLQTLFDLLKIVGVVIVLFTLDLRLGLFALCTTPVVLLLSFVFRRRASKAFADVRAALGDQNGTTTELIGGIRALRAYGREPQAVARYRGANARTARAWLDTVQCFSLFFALVDGALRLATILLLYVGAQAITEGAMGIGAFAQFWLYFGLLTGPIRELGEKYNVLQAAHASAKRIFAILAEPTFPPRTTPPGDDAPPSEPSSAPDPHEAVRVRRVDFAYAELPVLRGVDFTAIAGTTTAIVGPTGAGKSTLLGLVARFHDPDRGSVELHGVDVRRIATADLRRQMALVPQDVFLFRGSILDNVALFDPSIRRADVAETLDALDLTEWVATLPHGLDTTLEERGTGISQGHRQLLAMARALVRNPSLLILDEATASLDSATEQRLQRAVSRLGNGRTVLVVAHRLATVRHADQILVMENGAILERGNHPALLAAGGRYAEMVRRSAH